MGYLLTREVELAVQEEAVFGTSPGAVAGTDMFKHTSRLHITPGRARVYRDGDGDYQQASITSLPQTGRQASELKVDADLIPSGNAATPTEPDVDVLLKCHFGTRLKGTAHTTLTSGSTASLLKLTAGGGASSGVAVGQFVAVDMDGSGAYEARRVISVATDDVGVSPALSGSPASGRAVKVGTTYKFLNTAVLSAYLSQWIAGTAARHAVPGFVPSDLELGVDFNGEAPRPRLSFAGRGKPEITHAVARPTPSTAGVPLVPTLAKVWIGTTLLYIVSASLKSNNGVELRENESSGLYPTGAKRTANNARYMVEQTLSMLYGTGTPDTVALYESAKATDATPFDVTVQLGQTPGSIVAWATPRFVCDPVRVEVDGEFGLQLSGRCIGTSGDDELYLAFL